MFAQYPLEVASAAGVWLTNSRGERVLDLYGGHAVAALGYDHPGFTAALTRQAHSCQFQSNAVAMAVRERAAARLVRFAQLPLPSVFLVNSGAEANENALKIALRATGRAHVAAIEGAFHGRTAAAGAVTFGAPREVVRLSAHPLRRELHPARRRRRADRRARDRAHRGGDRRAGAGPGRARSTSGAPFLERAAAALRCGRRAA